MSNIVLKNVYKVYNGGVRAVSNFNLEIKDKEFIVFVGPSGCGKSTTLRMIAGLEEITSGDLLMNGTRVNDVEPKDRNIAMVFQSYALYPHMTVFQNMAFGLKIRKVPKEEIKERVESAAKILGIDNLLTRKPKALSGGQRQRVALGRAIVREPSVFLLDEPLSNLDAKLRVAMRVEITKLQKRLSTTFIYVTHDQTEAMTMGDRIVVMKDGLIQQCDSPAILYEQPCNIFVATFLGSPQMNIFKVRLTKEGNDLKVIFGNNQQATFTELKARQLMSDSYLDQDIFFGIRPENVSIGDEGVEATIDAIEHLGSETILYCKIDGLDSHFVAKIPTNYGLSAGQELHLVFDMDKSHGFDMETTKAIIGTPTYNHINASYKEGIKFGDIEIDNRSSRLLEGHILGSKLHDLKHILVDVNNISFNEIPDAVKLTAKIDFKIIGSDQTSYYSKIEGIKDIFVFKAKEQFNEGDEVELYIPLSKLDCYDSSYKKINSKEEVTVNECICNVTVNGDTTSIHLPHTTLKYKGLNVTPGTYKFILNDSDIEVEHTKEFCKENKMQYTKHQNTLFVKSYDEDKLDDENNIIYVANNNFDNYLTIKVKNDFSVYHMNNYNLVIKENDFKLVKIENKGR